ncbi:MAG: hypothetical protein J1F67_01230 [Muribaculaceae bacterium]|nr:hypothetical protein [Muribaculaceae bacterium]
MQKTIADIKKNFFSLRNGIIADSLRKLYPTGKIIYGLNVPQFMQLAKKYPKDVTLGLNLWDDKGCRESRLFSLYLIPPSELEKGNAKSMLLDVDSTEEAEFLPFRLLRHLPYARELYEELEAEQITDPLPSYCLGMFKKNLGL